LAEIPMRLFQEWPLARLKRGRVRQALAILKRVNGHYLPYTHDLVAGVVAEVMIEAVPGVMQGFVFTRDV
jgi:hypothetical protein